MLELSRFEMIVGKEGIEKLKNSSIIIFGVGGVGSYAAEAIARSASFSSIFLQLNPASTKTLASPLSTNVAFPELPLPNIDNLIFSPFYVAANSIPFYPKLYDFRQSNLFSRHTFLSLHDRFLLLLSISHIYPIF